MTRVLLALVSLGAGWVGCAGTKPPVASGPLAAPPGAADASALAVTEGNRLFAQGQWEQARIQYEAAIAAQPTLAEAHYDLALALERLGHSEKATVHYKEAATLAPGHKIIWNAPPFRQYDAEVRDSMLERKRPKIDPQRPY